MARGLSTLRRWLLLLALLLPLGAGAAEFVPGIEDLPLMPGLTVIAGPAPVKFDSPQGRIVIAFAEGSVQADHVMAFYVATLPQLGWAQTGATQFKREGESLTFEFARAARGLTVRFNLSPS